MFSVLFTEPAGETANPTAYNDSFSTVKYGGRVHTQIRRFISVRCRREFCFACPVFTYGGKATLKRGVYPNEHAIAYSDGSAPTLLRGESGLKSKPICIVNLEGLPPLNQASRIYFGIHHPIQYNVKVKDLGDVHPQSIRYLRGYFNEEERRQGGTMQDIAVTNDQGDEDEDDDDDEI
ncbi:hypothetical protein BDV96DRAFT_495262 [Lophiotrema nucula]|uniref:DUF6590 domain-containing protein n=1 Tax=Lophiotrema nucula TaxID=690887 RepID=A0A6A5Z576_9PLEO|nr:hypothetical protein BDV96DRAFT_495262 [Lophiotrema nucula]